MSIFMKPVQWRNFIEEQMVICSTFVSELGDSEI